MAQHIPIEAVRRAAALAKLIITDGELAQARADMEDMRQAIEALRSVPLSGGDVALARTAGSSAMREDESVPPRISALKDVLQRAVRAPAPRWMNATGQQRESLPKPPRQTDESGQQDGTIP